jgi:hypothetical protein
LKENKIMKTYLLAIAVLFCISGVWAQTRQLSSFSEVSTQESINVKLKKGSSNTAQVSARGLDETEVLTEVSNGRLKIELVGTNYRDINVDVIITYTDELEGLFASSSSSITVEDNLKSNERFVLDVSSSGNISMKQLTAPSVDMKASSSGDIEVGLSTNILSARASSSGELVVSGNAESSTIKTSSSGEFDGYSFITLTADVSASSGSSIKLEVKENLTAKASSGGSVRYNGNPKNVDNSASSGGSIKG